MQWRARLEATQAEGSGWGALRGTAGRGSPSRSPWSEMFLESPADEFGAVLCCVSPPTGRTISRTVLLNRCGCGLQPGGGRMLVLSARTPCGPRYVHRVSRQKRMKG